MSPAEEANAMAVLARRLVHTRVAMFGVSALTLCLGCCMGAMKPLKLDPEIDQMSAPMLLLLYAFASLFVITGILGFFVGIFRSGGEERRLLHALQSAPHTIALAERWDAVAAARMDNIAVARGSRPYLRVTYTDGKVSLVMSSEGDIALLLGLLWHRAPQSRPRP